MSGERGDGERGDAREEHRQGRRWRGRSIDRGGNGEGGDGESGASTEEEEVHYGQSALTPRAMATSSQMRVASSGSRYLSTPSACLLPWN